MKTNRLILAAASAGLLVSCAAVPSELTNARAAYHRASTGPAAQAAPAEVHVARQALASAEQSFEKAPRSYVTRDLAYVAQRKAELAEVTAAIYLEKASQARSKDAYQSAQADIIVKTKDELGQARAALENSERSGEMTEERLAASHRARINADERTAATQAEQAEVIVRTKDELGQTRTALEDSKRSGAVTEEQLSASREARVLADERTAAAQAALAELAAVKEEQRGVVITLSGSVLFSSNVTSLVPQARARLNRVADVLLQTRDRRLSVEGYTDSQGSDSHNLELSQRRAEAVRNFFLKRGYQAALITARGFGEASPIADNNTAEGRALNRRVEIVIQSGSYTSNPHEGEAVEAKLDELRR